MKPIFKSTFGTPNKVADTNFSEHYPSVNKNMEWSQLAPYIKQSIRTYIIPFIGVDMYDAIATAYENNTTDEVEKETIDLLQDAVAYYSIYHAMPKLNAVIAERGVQEQNDSKGTSRSISMWRFKNTRWDIMMNADNYLDQLMAHMEEGVENEVLFFDDWKNSDAYKNGRSDFFRGTNDLNSFLKINNSRKTFLALLPYLKKVEQLNLVNVLCEDQYEAILDPETKKEEQLYFLCRNYIAWSALEMAIPELRVYLDGDGVQFVMTTDGMNITKEAYESGVAAYQHRSKMNAEKAGADLMYFLQKYAEDFPLWDESPCRPVEKQTGYWSEIGAVGF